MGGGGAGTSQSFGYLNHQGPMDIPSRGYHMGISGSIPVEEAHTASYIQLSYAGPSQHELLFFMVSLKILTLLTVSEPDSN